MTVAKVIEVVGKSNESWEDAVQQAIKEASKTVRNIQCVDVQKMTANVKDGKITEYKVDMKLLFVIEREK